MPATTLDAQDLIVDNILKEVGSDESLGWRIIHAIKAGFNITSNGFGEEDILSRLDDGALELSEEQRVELVDKVTSSPFWCSQIGSLSTERGNEELDFAVRDALAEMGFTGKS